MDEAEHLLARIDERTLALKQGLDRMAEDLEDSKGDRAELRARIDGMWSADYAGLRRIIREEIDYHQRARGLTLREWGVALIALIGLTVSFLDFIKT